MSSDPQTGRRAYDDPSGMVVPLREHLEGKIVEVHRELDTRITQLEGKLISGQAQSTKEHAEVRSDLADLHRTVTSLAADDLRDEGADRVKRTIWKAATAIIGAMGVITGAAFVIADHLH